MKVHIFFWLGMAAVMSAHCAAIEVNDPNALQSEIKGRGAKIVIQELWNSPEKWANVTEKIETGESNWIDVAVLLRAGSDGGASADLINAMFGALRRNPKYVLQHALAAFPLNVVCSGRTDPLSTYKAALSELRAVKTALNDLKTVDLEDKRRACIARIDKAQKKLPRFFDRAKTND